MSWQEAWEWLSDRWQSDSVFREHLVLAVLVGAIGFAWAIAEASAVTRIQRAADGTG